jgi:hypothetical protein
MQLARVGTVGRLRGRKLCQVLGRARLDAILDHSHLHGGQPQRMQGEQIAAVGEDLLGMSELTLYWLHGLSIRKNGV